MNSDIRQSKTRLILVLMAMLGLVACGCTPPSVPPSATPGAPSGNSAENGPVVVAPASVTWEDIQLTKPSRVDELERQLTQVAGESEAGSSSTDLAGLAAEVAALRQDLRSLRASMEQYLGMREAALRMENERLRLQLEYLRSTRGAPPATPFSFQGDSSDAAATTPAAPALAAPTPSAGSLGPSIEPVPAGLALATVGDLSFAVIKRWDGATGNNAKAPRSHGLICAVPPGTTDDRLAQLGQWVAAQYPPSDAVTVDLFDGVENARRYAEQAAESPDHRSLDIKRPENGVPVVTVRRAGPSTP